MKISRPLLTAASLGNGFYELGQNYKKTSRALGRSELNIHYAKRPKVRDVAAWGERKGRLSAQHRAQDLGWRAACQVWDSKFLSKKPEGIATVIGQQVCLAGVAIGLAGSHVALAIVLGVNFIIAPLVACSRALFSRPLPLIAEGRPTSIEAFMADATAGNCEILEKGSERALQRLLHQLWEPYLRAGPGEQRLVAFLETSLDDLNIKMGDQGGFPRLGWDFVEAFEEAVESTKIPRAKMLSHYGGSVFNAARYMPDENTFSCHVDPAPRLAVKNVTSLMAGKIVPIVTGAGEKPIDEISSGHWFGLNEEYKHRHDLPLAPVSSSPFALQPFSNVLRRLRVQEFSDWIEEGKLARSRLNVWHCTLLEKKSWWSVYYHLKISGPHGGLVLDKKIPKEDLPKLYDLARHLAGEP